MWLFGWRIANAASGLGMDSVSSSFRPSVGGGSRIIQNDFRHGKTVWITRFCGDICTAGMHSRQGMI